MKNFEPSYIKLLNNGKLEQIVETLYKYYDNCRLCPRNCRVNRNKGEQGTCSSGIKAKVCSAQPHFGEERPLVGQHGSGTIFLSNCNLLCIYCQNWDISHGGEGKEVSDDDLAQLMLSLRKQGCHNINFVTPTHYLPNIVSAIAIAASKGLDVPIVYNTGGYDRVEVLELLEGVMDIYLPDYKYSHAAAADAFSQGADDYVTAVKFSLIEMHRQVGVLQTDTEGVAQRGLIIRHLVLPNGLAGTEEFVRFVSEDLHPDTYVNIMNQYRSSYKACRHNDLCRSINASEYKEALEMARKAGLHNLD